MTCIIGYEDRENNRVVMGGDSLSKLSDDYITNVGVEPKVWKRGGMLFGSSGTHRDAQLLQYAFSLPRRRARTSTERYLAAQLVPRLWMQFKEHGRVETQESSGKCLASSFLIAVGSRLYSLDPALSFERYAHGFACLGQGTDVALGAMRASLRWKMSAEDRVRLALEQAAFFCDGVSEPFHILST